MDTYATLNDALVKLFRDVMDLEEQAIITQEFQDITNNDVHVIQAIGTGEPKNMSTIAKELSVTVGTLTIAMNSLVKYLVTRSFLVVSNSYKLNTCLKWLRTICSSEEKTGR